MASARIAVVECPADVQRERSRWERCRWEEHHDCRAERRAFLAVLRTLKPAGYVWRLWHDPRPHVRKQVPTHPLRTPAWAYPIAAHLVEVPYAELQEAARLNRIRAWEEGRDPWAYSSRDGTSRRARRVRP